MKLGIVGLPNVGKSTLFNAITKAGAESANYPFCTIDPNLGVVDVPDERLHYLAEINHSAKIVPATVNFYDIAGLVKGASKGEGLGNQFLAHIREVDAIVHVVRCFEDDNVVHVEGSIGPARDIETIQLELILADMDNLQRRLQRVEKQLKGDRSLQTQVDLMRRIQKGLEDEIQVKNMDFSEEEWPLVRDLQLLSAKPVIYVANIAMDDINKEDNLRLQEVRRIAEKEEALVLPISAQIEEELAELSQEDAKSFLEDLGLQESGLDQLIRASYALLNLISFITSGPMETKAWTIQRGTPAVKAAGKIHTDIERGFIRAEVIDYDSLRQVGDMQTAKEKGLLRLEGKEYALQDGDIVHFRFNV